MRGEKPVHIVPQSFGSEKGPQTWWRLPTAAEEICMGYLALVHGAKGLFYYRFDVQQYDKSLRHPYLAEDKVTPVFGWSRGGRPIRRSRSCPSRGRRSRCH